MLCIADEAGRLWVMGCSEQERGWVPHREDESWLCLMHKVGVLQVSPVFGRAHADITLSENGAVVTRGVNEYIWRSAASKAVMRPGRHFARFTVVQGTHIMFSVLRPGWDVEGGAGALNADGHGFDYRTANGRREPGWRDWEGMQDANKKGDCIGILLDLDQGSMTVWKNDEKLGVMKAEGLSGPLCWAVETADMGYSACIESSPAPASPTEEELAAAQA